MHELLFAGKASPGGAAWQRLLGALLLVLGGTFAGMTVWANGQSSGGTGVVPAEGLRLWLRADKGVALDYRNEVKTWADQSGNGNDLHDTLWQFMPGHSSAVFSGLQLATDAQFGKSVYFTGNGSSYGLVVPSVLAGANSGEMYVVIKAEDSGGYYSAPFQFGSGHSWCYPYIQFPYTTNGIYEGFGRTSADYFDLPASMPIYGNWRIYNVASGPGGWAAWLDDTLVASTTASAPKFGTGGGQMGLQHDWLGNIAEILVYDRVLNGGESSLLKRYLNQKYVLNIAGVEPVAFDFWDDGDTDGDGIPDYWESFFGSNPFRADEWSDPGDTGHTVAERLRR